MLVSGSELSSRGICLCGRCNDVGVPGLSRAYRLAGVREHGQLLLELEEESVSAGPLWRRAQKRCAFEGKERTERTEGHSLSLSLARPLPFPFPYPHHIGYRPTSSKTFWLKPNLSLRPIGTEGSWGLSTILVLSLAFILAPSLS